MIKEIMRSGKVERKGLKEKGKTIIYALFVHIYFYALL